MATRKRRRSTKARKPPKTPPPPAKREPGLLEKREPGPLEKKFLAVFERGLDLLAEDPERVIRMGEGVIAGGREALRFIHENPEDARRTARNTLISFAAKMTKKKLRGE